jgi:cell division protein ZapA
MAAASVQVLGHVLRLNCPPEEARRLADLAAALEARVAALVACEPDSQRRLAIAALALMDDLQGAGAALMRARREVERLTDLLLEASDTPRP